MPTIPPMEAADIAAARRAWEEAARDLGISVRTQECWLEADDGSRHEVIAIVESFGTQRGTVLLGGQHDSSIGDVAAGRGFYCSVVSPSYETYDRELFVETLNDWGWRGSGDPPAWYTGQPWS